MASEAPKELQKTCRHCLKRFLSSENFDKACRYHPESFTGETAQRWMAPGETEGGGDVHDFYSCCGSRARADPGCCYTRHSAFGEPEEIMQRRPGMGIPTESSVTSALESLNCELGKRDD